MSKPRVCERCPELTGGRYARFCRACRWRDFTPTPPKNVRLYVWTPERDAYLRANYKGGTIREMAQAFGWPKSAHSSVKRRISELGLIKHRGHVSRPWTREEMAYLEEHAGRLTVSTMAEKLGRTPAAVKLKCRHIQVSTVIREGYTIQALVACFGESEDIINRWLRLGLFGRVRYRSGGYTRATARDPVCLTEPQVHAFIRRHRREYRLERVEQAWFLDVAFDQASVVGNSKGSAAA